MSVVMVPALACPDALWTLRSLRRLPGRWQNSARTQPGSRMDRRSAVDEPRYRIIEVVEVDELFRQIREMYGNVFNNSACAFVLSRALNWSPRLFMRFQFVQAAVTLRLTWKPSRAFLRDASHRARNNFWWQKDHSGVPTGLRGFTLKRATCAATSCFTHRRDSVRTSIPVPGVFPRRRFAPVKRIYIYMYGISMHILWDAISQLCAAEVEANAAVGCLIYILYIKGLKSPTRQTITLQTRHKSEKRGKDDTHEVRRGFTVLFDFPKNASWDIQTHRCTKVIKHCACAVKSTSLGR